MDPKRKPQNSVHFHEQDKQEKDWEDVESDIDGSLNLNQSTNLSKTSSAVKCSGDVHSASSINTSILDDTEEIKSLKEKLSDAEARCKFFENENSRINANLIAERNRNQKLEKKLQFVKDNQEVFMRLKEAYINMKYNEAAGRKMVEIREMSMQTWEGILCRSCLESEDLRRQMEHIRTTYNDSFIISP
ncbi:hypothetical protein NQ317_001961 [Molorchus minor]|uniref:Uncharacterized protein n=1 Tax=Molorchus minor TaxID=1323400 RepID=A0ABQ9JA75_9CUCU|nr:hypothetical protein NQ317_001961 [Molorchus minor]